MARLCSVRARGTAFGRVDAPDTERITTVPRHNEICKDLDIPPPASR